MSSIWKQLPKPFFALAPMDDVTDTVFRQIIASCSKPDVMFTEFVSVDGLQSRGREALMKKLRFIDAEKPLVAQVWGMKPDNYARAARELTGMGFDGIDINMGCPVPKVVKLGACSALVNNRELAAEIIAATKSGAGSLPVSVKTRLGYDKVDLSWPEFLLEQKLDALTVHGRTSKQLSKGRSDWDMIGHVRQLRDDVAPSTVMIGNGDVVSKTQAYDLAAQYSLDGVMIGRGIFKDPYLFADTSPWASQSRQERLDLYKKHIELFEQTWGSGKNPAVLKKFAKVYVHGFDGAGDLRTSLMSANTTKDLIHILDKA